VKLFWRLRRRLAKERPTFIPVRVVFRKMQDDGWTHSTNDRTRWLIKIRKGLSEAAACETLVHEWAHAVSDFRDDPHDDRYWIEHGKCYRVWERLIEGDRGGA
jgi:hypothetical protein